MGNVITIDFVVRKASLSRKIWDNGKYVLFFALSTPYSLNVGYHFIQVCINHRDLDREQTRIELEGYNDFDYLIGLPHKIGVSNEEWQKNYNERLKHLKEDDKIHEIEAKIDYHFHKALNPFY